MTFKNGNIPWNRGIPCDEKVKEKIRIANLGKFSHRKDISKYPIKYIIKEYQIYKGSRIDFALKIIKKFKLNVSVNAVISVTKRLKIKKLLLQDEFICESCGRRFMVNTCVSNKRKTRFCSKKCYGKHLSGKYPPNIPKNAWKKAIITNRRNGVYKRYSIRMLNGGAMKARKANCTNKINKPETKILNIINQEGYNFEYVGNSKKWIGRFNPDFINEENKKIIEVYGNYWHNLPTYILRDVGRKQKYKESGYELLIIWEKEINQNIQQVKKKLKQFCSNDAICSEVVI